MGLVHAPLPTLLLLLLASACGPEPAPEAVGVAWAPPGDDAVQIDAVAGPVPLAVRVRAVNAWGVPVAHDPVDVVVGHTTETVTLDAYGYGTVVVDTPGTVSVSAGEVAVGVQALANGSAPPRLPRAVPAAGPARVVVPASRGVLVATDDAVWFAGVDGRRFPVLTPLDSRIDGLQAVHLDEDGVIDAIAWTEHTVVLLRGRPQGGVAWAGAIRASSRVGSATAGDTTGDRLPDVAIAWNGSANPVLEVWEADGPESWAPAIPADLPATPVGMTASDNAGLGRDQITVTGDDGGWSRLARSVDDRYAFTGPMPPSLALDLPVGTVPESGGDYDGDGADELFLFGPRVLGADRTFSVWHLAGDRPSVFQTSASEAWAALADAGGDGLVDLWTLDGSGQLSVLAQVDGTNAQQPVATLPESAPFAAGDADGDRVPYLALAGERAWSFWPGARTTGGTWSAALDPVRSVEAGGEVAAVAADLDGDPATMEVATLSRASGSTTVDLYRATVGPDPTLVKVGSTALSASGVPVDLVTCDGVVYALLDNGLWALSWDGTTLAKTDARPQSGQALACGDGPGLATVAILDGGVATLREAALVVTETRDVPGAAGLAFVPGPSGPDLATCDTPGCTVVPWAWGDAGEVGLAHSDAAGIAVDEADVQTRLDGPLALAAGDVDGDGHSDLVASGGGWITIYPSTGQGYGAGWSLHAHPAPLGVPALADFTGDGADEMVWVDAAGNLVIAGR